MPPFLSGRTLSQRFYAEVIRPLLQTHMPQLVYAAAHLGPGSDVLGFDTAQSTDHDWGPRFILFLRDGDLPLGAPLDALFRAELPQQFYGYPVSISAIQPQHEAARGVPDHRIVLTSLRTFVATHLAYDLDQPLTPADWLSFSAQKLRELTAGTVHHDGIGDLTALRTQLQWYARDVWLYLLAAGWHRIAQEEHLMPRAGSVGDELGSTIIGARLVRDVMQLGFLYEQQYAPYPKWFGTAFRQLRCAGDLAPHLEAATRAATWPEREAALATAYTTLAQIHNASGVTPPLPATTSFFFDRPFTVIMADRFAEALRAAICDPLVQAIAAPRLLGNIDQVSDNTDLRTDPRWRRVVRELYHPAAE